MNNVGPQNQVAYQRFLEIISPACVLGSVLNVIQHAGNLNNEGCEKVMISSIWSTTGILCATTLAGPGSLDWKVSMIYNTVIVAEIAHVLTLAPGCLEELYRLYA